MVDFATLEASRLSRPAEIYRFDFGAEIFRFTSAAQDIVFGGATYTAVEMKRSDPQDNPAERRNNRLTVQINNAERPFSDYVGIQPAVPLTCTISRIQLDEAATASPLSSPQPPTAVITALVLFQGYVTSVAFKGRNATVQMNPNTEQFYREIPRFKYHAQCNHVLYDTFCTLDRNSFAQSGLVNGIDGNVISVSGFTGTAFIGGYVQNASGTDYRMILDHSADALTLLLPFADSVLGTTVKAFQGCDHTVQTCKTKFNNVINFGGYPYVPSTNIFTKAAFIKN
jgi:hypothetical protein